MRPGSGCALWRDRETRDGAAHMAIDEALLHSADAPALRFYTWTAAEITLGYFTPLARCQAGGLALTRRWTGGGVVEHGEDVTFALAVPAACLMPGTRAAQRYRSIHQALSLALASAGLPAALAAPPSPLAAAPGSPRCFASPVAWDLLAPGSGAKIAGGAQRVSRAGLLHQGSVRLPPEWRALDHPWIAEFTRLLSGDVAPAGFRPAPALLALAGKLEASRYRHAAWLERR